MWLWESLGACGALSSSTSLRAVGATTRLADLVHSSIFGSRRERLSGASVLLAVRNPLTAALALIELDGLARRIVLCPPDLQPQHLPAVIEAAQADVRLHDEDTSPVLEQGYSSRHQMYETEWVLLSSGTTGVPKLVLHTLASLCAALDTRSEVDTAVIWSTFYDIRRYGGLQILLRALHTGSLLLRGEGESVPEFLARAGSAGVTHISGTPSHWRAALMSGAATSIAPRYVRLSGEIADQAILDNLRSAYPQAHLVHAFASTEAGVAFEVQDGHAGFPASLLRNEHAGTDIEMKIVNETLQIRSSGNARRYLGSSTALKDPEGFVDTGDRVQLRDDRYYFAGRSGGIINVGGFKVHPEEIEAVINSHPAVRISRVSARRSPITGAVVVAEVVPSSSSGALTDGSLSQGVLDLCRAALPPYKVPALVRIVDRLEVSAAGKLIRA